MIGRVTAGLWSALAQSEINGEAMVPSVCSCARDGRKENRSSYRGLTGTIPALP